MTMQSSDKPSNFLADKLGGRHLRDVFGRFVTGITVITAPSSSGPISIVANSFSSVSLDPALVLWSADRLAKRYNYFEAADHYAIHVLSVEQSGLCKQVLRSAYALNEYPHLLNADGVPLIDHCLARLECRRIAAHDAGDHVIIVGQVQRTEIRDGAPLTFFSGDYGTFTSLEGELD
ncbi:MAG TPA: flavin oxidoreductase [Rhodobacteraceae bacterium]|nr:flavin reductase family protein [Alphaproteobacteria bacterium]MCH9831905.1 flavin reductase family protein [Alphaproteobacteria bacterium]HAB39217.1 flavin oxidoreductase [Paracoccaceae bacterium]